MEAFYGRRVHPEGDQWQRGALQSRLAAIRDRAPTSSTQPASDKSPEASKADTRSVAPLAAAHAIGANALTSVQTAAQESVAGAVSD